MDRNEAIAAIKTALKTRTGRTWSVTGGRGTGHGWIRISAPPARCGEFGAMSEDDRRVLGEALGLGAPAHHQGESVPASSAHRREYVNRAQGLPYEVAAQYWD